MKSASGTFVISWALAFAILLPASTWAASDCECIPVSCGVCQEQVNLEFYTEKCNSGKKVKSCKRPVCADKDPLPQTCIAKDSKATSDSVQPIEKTEAAKTSQKAVGTLIVAVGESFVTRRAGDRLPGKMAM
jgi:hypothetical protein